MHFPFPWTCAPPIWYLRLHTSQCRPLNRSWVTKAWEKWSSPLCSSSARSLHVVSFASWPVASRLYCIPAKVSGPWNCSATRQRSFRFFALSAFLSYISLRVLQAPRLYLIWWRSDDNAIWCVECCSQWVQSGSPLTGSGSATTYMWSAKAKIAKQMENEICMVDVLFSPATTSESPARAVVLQLQVAFYNCHRKLLSESERATTMCIDQ